MSAPALKNRQAWMDRYKAPTVDELLSSFNKQLGGVVHHARERMLAIDGVKEEVSWQGVWRWTLVYRIPGEGERGWAYLVMDPSKPRLAVPVPDELISDLPVKKLSKFVRDGLAHAPTVDGVRWAHWEIQGKTQADDILSLAQFKLNAAKVER
jgi:hypothetical protein